MFMHTNTIVNSVRNSFQLFYIAAGTYEEQKICCRWKCESYDTDSGDATAVYHCYLRQHWHKQSNTQTRTPLPQQLPPQSQWHHLHKDSRRHHSMSANWLVGLVSGRGHFIWRYRLAWMLPVHACSQTGRWTNLRRWTLSGLPRRLRDCPSPRHLLTCWNSPVNPDSSSSPDLHWQ